MNKHIIILLILLIFNPCVSALEYDYETKLPPKMFLKDLFRGKAQITFRNYYKKLLKDDSEESKKIINNIHRYRQLETENAFKHVFVSAKLTYVFGPKTALKLGYKKELNSYDIEIKNFGGKLPAFLDTNCDLWNNDRGVEYALSGKSQHQSFKKTGKKIFDNIVSDKSDFIIDYKNDSRRWVENATPDNIIEIIGEKSDELKNR